LCTQYLESHPTLPGEGDVDHAKLLNDFASVIEDILPNLSKKKKLLKHA
jgi:hypothetical protein